MKDLHLTKRDFTIQWFSGTGAGGQARNKNQNTCRITHIETGLRATCGDQRNRSQNQESAFKQLAQRILEHYKSQEIRPVVNTTTIRTYHEKDNRVKDHLSGLTQPYTKVVDGNHLDDMIFARAKAMLQNKQY